MISIDCAIERRFVVVERAIETLRRPTRLLYNSFPLFHNETTKDHIEAGNNRAFGLRRPFVGAPCSSTKNGGRHG